MKQALQRKRFEAALHEFGKKAHTYAKNSVHGINGMDAEDIEQELLWDLWVAVGQYDPSKGARFNAYVQTLWRYKIGKLKRAANAISRGRNIITISLDNEPIAEYLTSEVEEEIGSLALTLKMLDLSPKKAGVCIALAMKMELEDIYKSFDITRVEVEEIVEQLRHDWEFFRHISQLVRAG
jgi:DNA-directed RNA polymerase specialized sigma24 family protein